MLNSHTNPILANLRDHKRDQPEPRQTLAVKSWLYMTESALITPHESTHEIEHLKHAQKVLAKLEAFTAA